MARGLVVCLSILLAATGCAASETEQAREHSLEVRFLGNAAFAITDGATTVLTDFPYQGGAFGYMHFDLDQVLSELDPENDLLCLITHRHDDHFGVSLLDRVPCKVLGPEDVLSQVAAERRVEPVDGSASFGPIDIRAIETPHANVGHYSYRFTWHGVSMYLTGDTEEPETLDHARGVEVLFVTPWLVRFAREQGFDLDNRVGAGEIVLHHHARSGDDEGADCECRVPAQGDRWTLGPKRTGG